MLILLLAVLLFLSAWKIITQRLLIYTCAIVSYGGAFAFAGGEPGPPPTGEIVWLTLTQGTVLFVLFYCVSFLIFRKRIKRRNTKPETEGV